MDIQEYISSGILESYVIGASSEQEMKEVECLAQIYPGIKEELDKLELDFEKFAGYNSIDPPEYLKAKILTAIEHVKQITDADRAVPEPNLNTRPVSGSGLSIFQKIAVAASVALLIVIAGFWLNAYNKNRNYRTRLVSAEHESQDLKRQLATLIRNIEENEHINFILAAHATKRINLTGTKISPDSDVSVYWNTETREIFLKVYSLPEPEEDKQYQLWAIVNGKPMDMGVFETGTSTLQKMPIKVENAAAFAITLEKRGGSNVPTLSAIYVLGNV